MEPAGGFERSVSRLQFGCSAIELHRPANSAGPVPHSSESEKRRNHSFGEDLYETAMQPERDAHPAFRGQRHVVPRKMELFETIAALEFGERVVRAFVPVGVLAVGEMRQPPVGTMVHR